MSEYGLVVAGDSGSVSDGTTQYDTRRKKLLVDVVVTPKRLNILDDFNGGTNFTVTDPGDDGPKKEVLFEVDHNLGYVPYVEMYIYVVAAPGSPVLNVGSYAQDFLSYNAGGGDEVNDVLEHVEDTQKMQIVHTTSIEPSSGDTYTSTANDYTLRIKYFIFSNGKSQVLS